MSSSSLRLTITGCIGERNAAAAFASGALPAKAESSHRTAQETGGDPATHGALRLDFISWLRH
jgi:hypothetical protein